MSGTSSYRFALRPKWIVGHVLALVAIVGFINLGFWQLRRHDERSLENDRISERIAADPTALDHLLGTYGEDPSALEYRRALVMGFYLAEEELLWQARTLGGRSGHDVLTPLQVGTRALIVDRGWVPIDAPGPPVVGSAPPDGPVTVTGVLRPGRERNGVGPIDPETGELDRVSRVDIGRIQQQIDQDLYPFYLLLTDQTPAQQTAFPLLQDAPMPDSGPHLSYAVQWFVFALIAATGYPVLLRRTARDPQGRVPRRSTEV